MKLFLVFSVVVTLTVKGFEVEKIRGIEGTIRQIEFDMYNNSYVTAGTDSKISLYKLNDKNDVVLNIELPMVGYLLTSNEGDVYLLTKRSGGVRPIWSLKSNATEIKLLLEYNPSDKLNCEDWNFLDKDGNLYINEASGVAVVKSGQESFTGITALENFAFCQTGEDSEGNVYLGNSDSNNPIIYVVPKEAKQSPVPYGERVSGFENVNINFHPGYKNQVFVVSTSDSTSLELKKLTGNSSELLYSFDGATYVYSYNSQQRFFLVLEGVNDAKKYVYIFTSDGQVVRSEDVVDNQVRFPKEDPALSPFSNDDDDNVYVVVYFESEEKRKIMFIENNEAKLKYLNLATDYVMRYIKHDEDKNLWMVSDHLYVYSKNTGEVITVADLQTTEDSRHILQAKKGFGEMFIGAIDGLYIGTN